MSSKRSSFRHLLLHATRVWIFGAILLLIRWQYADAVGRTNVISPSLDRVQPILPQTHSINVGGGDEAFTLLDGNANTIGSALQTSPQCDHIIGFSGPTNVLMVFDAHEELVGIEVLSSGDTREHVKQVLADTEFLQALDGMTRDEMVESEFEMDAVSGATLTSLAIRESICCRLDGASKRRSLRFPESPEIDDVLQAFPTVASIHQQQDDASLWLVRDANGTLLGRVLSTSPVADNAIGYQGPTDTWMLIDPDARIVGITVKKSFDNEPYVRYVREDKYFASLFTGKTLVDVASFDLDAGEIEGVSGATMTSMAVAQGLTLASRESESQRKRQAKARDFTWRPSGFDVGTVVVVLLGGLIGMTSLRANARIRVCFQWILIGYLGLLAGNLLSLAMLVGWARCGIPWRAAFGLVFLSTAAFAVPITSKRNLYCTHLCPHGAAQQLLRNRVLRKPWRLPAGLKTLLSLVPVMLLAWCIVVAMTSVGYSLVDIEPFDAYLFRIAGWATISVAMVGLVASLYVPMAYCRYGCPTGALLQFLRFNAASNRWSVRDWLAVALLALAAFLWAI